MTHLLWKRRNKLYNDKTNDAVSDPIAEFTTRMNEKVALGKQFIV